MARINPVQKKDSGLSEILTIGGGIAGAIYGGPAGAAAGAGIGQMAGGMIEPAEPPGPNISGGEEASAMARRSARMGTDNLAALKQAEARLPELPEELRQRYSTPIIAARIKAERGMA